MLESASGERKSVQLKGGTEHHNHSMSVQVSCSPVLSAGVVPFHA